MEIKTLSINACEGRMVLELFIISSWFSVHSVKLVSWYIADSYMYVSVTCSMCYWFVLDLFIPRVQSILNIARESVGHGENQAPDCSPITDARNNESLFLLVKELDSNLDLKFKMPDDHARQVRDAFSLVLFCFNFILFLP